MKQWKVLSLLNTLFEETSEKKMKTIKLMNSAMMPQQGNYKSMEITKNQFVTELKKANKIESYIGYEQNANLIEDWTGLKIAINRKATTELKDGDTILAMVLKYRVVNFAKGEYVGENDFRFFKIEFNELMSDGRKKRKKLGG